MHMVIVWDNQGVRSVEDCAGMKEALAAANWCARAVDADAFD